MKTKVPFLFVLFLFLLISCKEGTQAVPDVPEEPAGLQEPFRPQFHFSPQEKWMNDPNGLVYNDGLYHLFYQYYPEDIVWGPMHWGHAVSKDLVFWEHRPIALFPDENGYIFSGSAVVDAGNSSGLGTADKAPLVAIFTYHQPDGEKAGRTDYQTQGIAYSTDNGQTWIKYEGNPILPNTEGYKDFRDPKVFWHEETGQWIMVLVAGDHARFYQSQNLLEWEYMSSFGKEYGAHGGVWECPDLFPLDPDGTGETKWVLLISINPGAPNGGSGTQYFIGDFDGQKFTTSQEGARWIDWGTDNYAGVTYNNVPSGDRIFIGWMSNWAYATATPTQVWRSAMTLARKLELKRLADGQLTLASQPIEDQGTIFSPGEIKEIALPAGAKDSLQHTHFSQAQLLFRTSARDFALTFTNEAGDSLRLILDDDQLLLDRRAAGMTGFDPDFASVQKMPLIGLSEGDIPFRLIMDWSSLEIFIDEGRHVMTAQVFPNEHFTRLVIENTSGRDSLLFKDLEIGSAASIWGQTPE